MTRVHKRTALAPTCDPRTVVLMENDPSDRDALSSRLEREKFRVEIAENEDACVGFLERGCEYFALDVDMGGGPRKTLGLAALRALKAASALCFCTIVTGNTAHETIAYKLGANGVFQKESSGYDRFIETLNREFLVRSSYPLIVETRALGEFGRLIRGYGTRFAQESGPNGAAGVAFADSDVAGQVLQEELAAKKYVVERYDMLVNRKYTQGLSPAEDEELAALRTALDDMDEPYYAEIIARLRKSATSNTTNAPILTQDRSASSDE